MGDSDPAATFGYVARELGRRKIAFIFTRESYSGDHLARLKEAFGGPLIANEQFTLDTAQAALEDGSADAIAWGKLFIANPDLPRRLELGAPLSKPVPETFYAEGETGYTDYPALSDAA